MDRERFNHPVTDEQASAIDARPEISLEQRKAEFLEAMRQIDPLEPLRRHPWVTVGTMMMFGVTAGSPHLAAKVKEAKGGFVGRIVRGVGLKMAQRFIAARAAKAHAAAMAAASPAEQATQASA